MCTKMFQVKTFILTVLVIVIFSSVVTPLHYPSDEQYSTNNNSIASILKLHSSFYNAQDKGSVHLEEQGDSPGTDNPVSLTFKHDYLHEDNEVNGTTHIVAPESMDMIRVLDGFVFLNNLYDSLVRPGQFDPDGTPTNIEVGVDIHPGLRVNEKRNEMTVTLTLTQNWTDPRLAYEHRINEPDKLPFVMLTGTVHQIEPWLPDTFIMNEKRVVKHENAGAIDLIRVDSKGGVSKTQRMTVTTHCPFYNNEKFPFDTHVCYMNFTSFSWNSTNVQYETVQSSCWLDVVSGVFTVDDCHLADVIFQRDEHGLGHSSGFIKYFELKRNVGHYIKHIYIPLATFTLISVFGLVPGIGAEIGAGLSYFMFGLMSIFMRIKFRGQDFSWGQERTALDSYYIYCVGTVLFCGLINLVQLHLKNEEKRVNSNDYDNESFEMHRHANGTSTQHQHQQTRNNNIQSSLWTDNFVDEDTTATTSITSLPSVEDEEASSSPRRSSRQSHVKVAIMKASLTKFTSRAKLCRINGFWCMLIVFISWNLVYWISH